MAVVMAHRPEVYDQLPTLAGFHIAFCNILRQPIREAATVKALPAIAPVQPGAAHLLKVGRQPVHDDVEGVVEGVVVDHDRPDSRVEQHASPGHCTPPQLASRVLRICCCYGH